MMIFALQRKYYMHTFSFTLLCTFLYFPNHLFSFYFTTLICNHPETIWITLWIFRDIRVSKLEWEGMKEWWLYKLWGEIWMLSLCLMRKLPQKRPWLEQRTDFYFLPKEVLRMTIYRCNNYRHGTQTPGSQSAIKILSNTAETKNQNQPCFKNPSFLTTTIYETIHVQVKARNQRLEEKITRRFG